MNVKDYIKGYKNHPVLFVGTGICLRYINESFSWPNLLKRICDDFFGNEKMFLDIKSDHQNKDKSYDYPSIGGEIERLINESYKKGTVSDKFNHVDATFYENMKQGINISRFKLYALELLKNYTIRDEAKEEIELFRKIRKNIACVITTNYDDFIEKNFKFNPLIGNDILLSNPYGSVYKIHGSVDALGDIIITDNDYKIFEEKFELIRAQLLSLFIHNPIIFMGYGISDENIKKILSTIFRYVDYNTELSKKVTDNFLLVEYDEGSDNIEVAEHSLDLNGVLVTIKKIKTDNYKEIYEALSNLQLPVSALDVRKVRDIVKTISEGGEINVQITENIDNLENKDKVLAIGTVKTINWIYDTVSDLMVNYFDIIEEANVDRIKLIDKYTIQKNQYFPMYGFSKINTDIQCSEEKKSNQKDKLKSYFDSLDEHSKIKYNSMTEIINSDLSMHKKYKVIYFNVYENNISINDFKDYLINYDNENRNNTAYKRLICLYDMKAYEQ